MTNRSFRAHKEENVAVDQRNENAHDDEDTIGRLGLAEALIQPYDGTGKGTIDGYDRQDPRREMRRDVGEKGVELA